MGTKAAFYSPSGIAVDAAGNLYVADTNNNEIRLISPNGYVTTLAGSTTPGDLNGNATAASFKFPFGIAVSSSGTLYVGDFGNNDIRAIAP
jgi:streptogramin lyase